MKKIRDEIPGYTYGTAVVETSDVSLGDLEN